MEYASLTQFVARGAHHLANGPVAIIMDEDHVEIDATIAHHIHIGFPTILVLGKSTPAQTDLGPATVVFVEHDTMAPDATTSAINQIIAKAPGTWFYYCYNAEFLIFPFCETRTIGEMLAFHTEERRDAVLSYVIDLYACDLDDAPQAVALDNAMLDKTGYYALARNDDRHEPIERQLDFHGGLRWRFEEHIPYERRRIDRISIFRAKSV